ncbi:DNA-binding transcription repressor ASH1 SCDLUD_004289 [Saccharomycodes ludwigii]|uniref:DNA-binding transcription repressor ASH1 n=1 Tax=Saccharomycodes ludwigii TaxID=36035 RepID=UPI001E85AA8C|nr:hypothetical protein SCDLUD_004289 [Saccharomycodes ludwigii]KAH3899973.1 hypothetical protein SCDLUD_004289 [Saccharomycodes ludwigii]
MSIMVHSNNNSHNTSPFTKASSFNSSTTISGKIDSLTNIANNANATTQLYNNYTAAPITTAFSCNEAPQANNLQLPSLKHLKLLPNPQKQENSYNYPDTSEPTPYWRQNLMSWCKKTSYEQYLQIHDLVIQQQQQQQQHAGKTFNNKLDVLASVATISELPCSIVNPHDQFYGLSNTSSYCYSLPPPIDNRNATKNNATVPTTNRNGQVTPPQSPEQIGPIFTPMVSGKLLHTIKIVNQHKKTNSFKARQLKKILNNRDVLQKNSLTLQKRKSNKVTKANGLLSCNVNGKILVESFTPPTSPQHSDHIDNTLSSNNSFVSTPRSSYNNKINKNNDGNNRKVELIEQSRTTTASSNNINNNSPTFHTFVLQSSPVDTKHNGANSMSSNNDNCISHTSVFTTPATAKTVATSASKGLKRFKDSSPTNTPTKKRRKSLTSLTNQPRKCISCHSMDSPCWRPSWSGKKHDQLCNSCGLRYKKTHSRCLNDNCRKIPSKGELSLMKTHGEIQQVSSTGTILTGLSCLFCGHVVETK